MNKINTHSNNSGNQQNGDPHIPYTEESSNKHPPYSVTVDDITVRLHFKDNGDITSRLTDAFNSMLS